MITADRIQQLAKRKGVQTEEVTRFLLPVLVLSHGGVTCAEALAELQSASTTYGWTFATVNAIQTGILEHYQGE